MSVCVCPGSVTTQWLTLSLIEPIHRTSQRWFNRHPRAVHIHATTIILQVFSLSQCLCLPPPCLEICPRSSFGCVFIASLCVPPHPPSSSVTLVSFSFISHPPRISVNLFLFFNSTCQTCIAAGLCNISIDKTHSMPSHTNMHTHIPTMTCLSAHPWQTY